MDSSQDVCKDVRHLRETARPNGLNCQIGNLKVKQGAKSQMTTTMKSILFSVLFTALTLLSNPAWAIYPPELQSGGKYFAGKGTRAGQAASQETAAAPTDEFQGYAYSKTEDGLFDYHNYAKGIHAGPVYLRPSLAYVGEYDSNIFLEDEDADGDYISRLLSGVDAYMPLDGGKYVVKGGVYNETEFFAKNSSENHTDFTYQLGAEANLEKVQLQIFDEFRDTSQRSDSELTQRVQRYENRLSGLATIPFGEFFSETEVTHFLLNFSDDGDTFEPFDRYEISVYPRIGVNVGTRTQALLEYGYTHIGYDTSDRDGNVNQLNAGLRGFLGNSDLVTYQVWGGFQIRTYEGDLQNFYNFVGRGQLAYKPDEISQFILEAVRRPEESLDAGQTYYVRNDVSLRYRRQIAESWFASVRAGAGFNHYNSQRLDFIWEPGVGLEYVLPGKVLALFTEYKFSARHSDVENRDYNRHIANFGVRAAV